MAYLPLSTANLPDPVIDPAQGATADQHFDVGIWAGDGVNGRTIADLYGHTPDFVWIKNRTNAIDHNVADVLRGWKELYPNLTNAEGGQQMNAPTNDGLSGLPSSNGYNASGSNYVSWAWKANGSGVSNNAGSIPSTVSANTTSGFSIVSYTGTGSAATVGHGLDSAPEMIIVKSRNDTDNWLVYHIGNTYSGSPENSKLRLNTTGDGSGGGTPAIYWNSTAPTSSVFSVGTNGDVNQSSELYISYCFHSVEGFSKFSSYVGNGSADGPFVYTGFRPKMLIWKRTDGSGQSWEILDDQRDPYNGVTHYLYPDLSNAENNATGYPQDFLSNGFKIRHTGGSANLSGGTYIYMAFAENPFKYSNAR